MLLIRNDPPIQLIIQHPDAKEAQQDLAQRVADIHTTAVIRRLHSLNCPAEEKRALLEAIIDTVLQQSREQV